jgi:hypothetical protein
MTYSTEHPKAAWGKVMHEAFKQPFNAGLYELGFAALHFAGAAALGSPYLLRWGCAWGMMGATHLGLHTKSILNPGPSDKAHDLPKSVRAQKPKMPFKLAMLEVAKHPFKSGALEVGGGVAAFGAGMVAGNPLILGVGGSLVPLGLRRMDNYLAGIRFPELVAK